MRAGSPAHRSRGPGIFAGRAQCEREERVRRKRAAIPAVLRLDTTVIFRERYVKRVTFEAERQLLERYPASQAS